jgi:sortase A
VLDQTFGATLTLTTCNPRFSASQRLVVKASLDGTPVAAPPTTLPPEPSPSSGPSSPSSPLAAEGLSGGHASVWPAVWWGLLAAAVAAAVWLLVRRFHWLLYAAGAPVFLVVLFVFFEHLADVLPPGL